jgi:hypothetical protein
MFNRFTRKTTTATTTGARSMTVNRSPLRVRRLSSASSPRMWREAMSGKSGTVMAFGRNMSRMKNAFATAKICNWALFR